MSLDKGEILDGFYEGNSSLKSFMVCIEDSLREREAEEFGKGLDSKVKLDLYRSFGGKKEFKKYLHGPDSPLFPPSKKVKRHVDSKYQSEWLYKYRMRRSDRGETYAYCAVCNVDFSVAGGGVFQVKWHCQSKKHSSRIQELNDHPKIDSLVTQTKHHDQVTCAELYFTRFIAEHNLPFAVADHFNRLCPVMFPDSKIVAGFACARTKTAALITHALAPTIDEPLVKACQEQPFTLLCDGGNDSFEKKNFGIMVRFWEERLGKVVTRFLDAPVCNIATGETLFQALSVVLEAREIPWRNVIGFASDSASVMVGKRNSVLSRLTQKQPDVFSLGCVCVT